MSTLTTATSAPSAAVASLTDALASALARRFNDPHTCFIDWCVGAVVVGVFAAALLGVGVTLGFLIQNGGLWVLVALVLVTRTNSGIVRSVAEYTRGKYREISERSQNGSYSAARSEGYL